jgi:hypothetical protein
MLLTRIVLCMISLRRDMPSVRRIAASRGHRSEGGRARENGPQRARRCNNAVIPDQMRSRFRHQCRQSRDKVLRVENDVGGAVVSRPGT